MKASILTASGLLSIVISGWCQFDSNYRPNNKNLSTFESKVNMGPGVGVDYGGIGLKSEYFLTNHVGLFAGLGYAFEGVGFNAGIKCRVLSAGRITPYLLAFYGYNSFIRVNGMDQSDKLYYGPSLGAGFELHGRNNSKNFLAIELLFTIKSSEFTDDLNSLKNNPSIQVNHSGYFVNDGDLYYSNKVGLSIGYQFGLTKKRGLALRFFHFA